MAAQYIFQMQGLTKAFPGNRKVFENIWLSFYPDAKIGVLGVNGSGKSTLLKIMSGLDQDFSGEAKAAEGIKRGYLPQEPVLDPRVLQRGERWAADLVVERADGGELELERRGVGTLGVVGRQRARRDRVDEEAGEAVAGALVAQRRPVGRAEHRGRGAQGRGQPVSEQPPPGRGEVAEPPGWGLSHAATRPSHSRRRPSTTCSRCVP